MKKISAIFAVLIMLFTLSMPVFADNENPWSSDGTLTATGTQEEQTNQDVLQPTEGAGTLSPIDGTTSSNVTIPGRDSLIDNDQSTLIHNGYIDVMPVVTTDDILQWAVTKGNEIIYLLQVICQPFAIIIFIIAAFITLVGAIGKGDMVGKGIFSMIIACVVYAAALYAPVILQTFVGWVAS